MSSWSGILVSLRRRQKYFAVPGVRGREVMKAARQCRLVLATCGTLTEGRLIARSVVSKRLAACVNVVLSPADSYYTWKGKLERAREYLLVIKTTAKRLTELEKEVKRLHTYDLPEFLALPISAGSNRYLSWLEASVTPPRKKARYS
jgi:periplasmic divalent cation tolerance protein